MKITLQKDMIRKCWEFSYQCAKNERPIEYGEQDAHVRNTTEIAFDTLIGKLGEAAVQEFLHRHGIETEIDFRIMKRGQWDVDDVHVGNWRFDVKCTKQRSKNFLIEWNKLQFRADAGELPHFFLMTQLDFDMEKAFRDGVPSSCEVDCVGYIETQHLKQGQPGVLTLGKKDNIPGTHTPVTAKSFCVPFTAIQTDWEALCRRIQQEEAYSFAQYTAPGIELPVMLKEQRQKKKYPMAYSVLLSGREAGNIEASQIDEWIHAGIKVILFLSKLDPELTKLREELKSKYNPEDNEENKEDKNKNLFDERRHLQIYTGSDFPDLCVYDGRLESDRDKEAFQQLGQVPSFNVEQYLVEHAGIDQPIIVKASAGTGKTTVMIDRILFLLSTVENLAPADIGMITFTNKATANMIQKLQKCLLEMYRVTKKMKYQLWLEQLSEMQISTIDSFFKSVLQREGSSLGYGTKASIQSFIFEKKRILREVIDERFQQDKQRHPDKNIFDFNILSIHEYVDQAFWIWNELNSRGFFQEDIYKMDFGCAAEPMMQTVNLKLKDIVSEAERRYQAFKIQQNAFTVGDIKADMDALVRKKAEADRQRPFRFLFVDEFQDTDDSQIRSIVWLERVFGSQLFVVGDIKQSIYRFRGAEESAFAELEAQLSEQKKQAQPYVLKKNYRTSQNVMKEINRLFGTWGKTPSDDQDKQAGPLLDWEGDVESCIEEPGGITKNLYKKKDQVGAMMLGSVKQAIKEIKALPRKKDNSPRHVTILCRSNAFVKQAAELCREANISCMAKLKGGFYQSQPVRDFHAVLGALLYPEDAGRLYNLLLTPYCRTLPDTAALEACHGKEKALLRYFQQVLAKEKWLAVQQALRTEPFFTVLQDILAREPLKVYQERVRGGFKLYQVSGDPDMDTKLYQLNLNKLMQILYEKFTGEFASVLDVYDFLDNKLQTNRDEDMIYPDDSHAAYIVEAMTVHKAKGLEFDTVILPFVDGPFFQEEQRQLITDKKSHPVKAGWSFPVNHAVKKHDFTPGECFANDWYDELKGSENAAVRREEARLLYVALTRTMRHLFVLERREPFEDSWGSYLEDLQEVTAK